MCRPEVYIRKTFTATLVCAGLRDTSSEFALKSPSYTSENPPLSRNSPTSSWWVRLIDSKPGAVFVFDEFLTASSSRTEMIELVSSGERELCESNSSSGAGANVEAGGSFSFWAGVCRFTSSSGEEIQARESVAWGRSRFVYNTSSSEATRNIGHKIFNNVTMCEGCATMVSRTMAADVHHSDLRISLGFRSMSVCVKASWADVWRRAV